MSLVQTLRPGPVDIVGDIHGEYQALTALLLHLGYDNFGDHPDGRYLVFVGDFCDRGPDSPAVLSLIRRLVMQKKAMAVLGNHEINLLCGEAKDGSGWYFPARQENDKLKYAPFEIAKPECKPELVEFLLGLPIALEREDIRVIHAAWVSEKVEIVRNVPIGKVAEAFVDWNMSSRVEAERFLPQMEREVIGWRHNLEEFAFEPPSFPAHAEYAAMTQMGNPIKILTAGVERAGTSPFYSSGRWRFAERVQWWNHYYEDVPVVIGHYWRKFTRSELPCSGKRDPDLFERDLPLAWHGAKKNVFCVDYSIGGAFASRKKDGPKNLSCRLAALRWPERTLHFDNGEVLATSEFGAYNSYITK
jgi:3',5'-cyclic AMP phosphodiesterase CpdA